MASCPSCGTEGPPGALFCPNDGTPLDRPWRDPRIGTVLGGRYRILRQLGAGGMGAVYLAHSASLGIDVAVKLLHPGLDRDDRAVARFAREARATSRIDHENVVAVIDFGIAPEGFCFMVTEYVPGITLATEIERAGALPLTRALHIISQLAHALARAHHLGIVHRDLKPGNLMLSQRGSDADFLKLLDFGLAKSFHSDGGGLAAVTRAGELFGTPEYMAPEQWLGGALGPHTDVYAFGVVLWEMLVGRLPFSGSLGVLLAAHTSEVPVAPSVAARRELPSAVDALVARCLAKKPEERPRDMNVVLEGLRAAWSGLSRPSSTTSYAKTIALPRSASGVPDPTVYQSSQVDVVWDGPGLCDEIRRLHHLRAKRLAELSGVLWPKGVPPEVDALSREIGAREADVDLDGQEIAVLAAAVEEHAHTTREHEAALRGEMIEASLALQGRAELLFDDDPTEITSGMPRIADLAQTGSQPPPPHNPEARLRWAERRLHSARRKAAQQRSELEARLTEKISELRIRELGLAPLQERLSAIVNREAGRRLELRPMLVAFGQIDGAIAAYQALLEALDVT